MDGFSSVFLIILLTPLQQEWESRGQAIVQENFDALKGELEVRPEMTRRGSTQEAAPLPTHQ